MRAAKLTVVPVMALGLVACEGGGGGDVNGDGTFTEKAADYGITHTDQGRGVVLFPEGTSSDGATVLRFNPSLLEAATCRTLPVFYASLTYETPPRTAPARLAVCWWGDMNFVKHLMGLKQLKWLEASLTGISSHGAAQLRKALPKTQPGQIRQ